jgi:hypothetical protein
MIVQAAKIIGSGLATIGLTNMLLSLIHNNKYLISELIYTDLAKKAVFTIDEMIRSLGENSTLYKFLETEISKLTLHINAKNINGSLVLDKYTLLSSKKIKEENTMLSFNIAGVYIFKGSNNEEYVGSSTDFYFRLVEHKDQFKNKRKPTKLHLFKYKFNDYK